MLARGPGRPLGPRRPDARISTTRPGAFKTDQRLVRADEPSVHLVHGHGPGSVRPCGPSSAWTKTALVQSLDQALLTSGRAWSRFVDQLGPLCAWPGLVHQFGPRLMSVDQRSPQRIDLQVCSAVVARSRTVSTLAAGAGPTRWSKREAGPGCWSTWTKWTGLVQVALDRGPVRPGPGLERLAVVQQPSRYGL
jgi:hypothetical protein